MTDLETQEIPEMQSIVEAFPRFPDCPVCLGTGHVCEDHPTKAWGEMLSDADSPVAGACYCGAAGAPCGRCIETKKRMETGYWG